MRMISAGLALHKTGDSRAVSDFWQAGTKFAMDRFD